MRLIFKALPPHELFQIGHELALRRPKDVLNFTFKAHAQIFYILSMHVTTNRINEVALIMNCVVHVDARKKRREGEKICVSVNSKFKS